MPSRLIELVERLSRSKPPRVALIGDLMVDRYIYGNAGRLSPDAPVPVLHYQHEDVRLGGAGRVAADLATLGAKVHIVALIGTDPTADTIRKLLADYSIATDGLVVSSTRPSIAKVRLVGLAQHRHAQQMIRLDYEDSSPIDEATAERVFLSIQTALDDADALCIEDYNKGLLSPELCQRIIKLAKERNIPVFVDPAPIEDYSKYKSATTITPNRNEAALASGLPCDKDEHYQAVAERFLQTLDLEAAMLTLDKQGIYFATRDGQRRLVTTRPRKVYDVAGAGDMVLAMLTLARVIGADWSESVALGNTAAGLEVEKFGSVPITPNEIIQELMAEAHEHLGKQRSMDALLIELNRHRAAGKTIVFTNGCFDLLHLGHIKYFQFAKKHGDLLVVAVNTDSGIQRLKGPKRPISNETDRLSVLEELESIDYLVSFDEDTPLSLIQKIRPDVLVKGADYVKENVVGWDLVESYGGRVELAPLIEGRSTSELIRKITETYKQ